MAVDGGVGEHLAKGVEQHNVVVAYGSETLLTVPAVDVGDGERFALASGGFLFISQCNIRILQICRTLFNN